MGKIEAINITNISEEGTFYVNQAILRPFSVFESGFSNTTESSSTAPKTKHSLIKFAICFFGKFTIAII